MRLSFIVRIINAWLFKIVFLRDALDAKLEELSEGGGDVTKATRSRLTPREREILQLLAEGKSNKEIAALLGISVNTAEAHRANIMLKLDLHSISELVVYAVRNKIIQA